jgi:hypothetical protein
VGSWRLSLPDSVPPSSGADAATSAPTIYCPYANKDIPLGESNPEHIIPLSLGGLNGFTLPVSKDFNSRIGSEIDGALANDFLVMAKRDKHLVKGHSGKEPEFVTRKASDAETGAPLKVTLGQRKGLQIWSPTEKRDLTRPGKKVNIQFTVDMEIALRFVAKVALSAAYLVYGDLFRHNVKHVEFRTIMNHRPNEVGDAIYAMEARVDHRFGEPETDNDKILRVMCAMVAPHSIVALMPTSKTLAVAVGILGDYVGMISVPADTTTFPNKDEFRWGQFFILTRPVSIRDSVWKLLERMSRPR